MKIKPNGILKMALIVFIKEITRIVFRFKSVLFTFSKKFLIHKSQKLQFHTKTLKFFK